MGFTVYLNFEEYLPDGINSILPVCIGVSKTEAELEVKLQKAIWGDDVEIGMINRTFVINHADFERENPNLRMVGMGCLQFA